MDHAATAPHAEHGKEGGQGRPPHEDSAHEHEHDFGPEMDAVSAINWPPVTTGKFALWLFLATEVMFFAGLIGSYIVLRIGNPGWPIPADTLNVPLTALNTFILICSSVTMVKALEALEHGNQARGKQFLAATVGIGAIFLSIQVYEYNKLGWSEPYPMWAAGAMPTQKCTSGKNGEPCALGGASPSSMKQDSHWQKEVEEKRKKEKREYVPPNVDPPPAHYHFVPRTNIFASTFYIMTGCHGAHVFGGVVLLSVVLILALLGRFSAQNHQLVELAGLYWHFVDLVWILLFTVVYLM